MRSILILGALLALMSSSALAATYKVEVTASLNRINKSILDLGNNGNYWEMFLFDTDKGNIEYNAADNIHRKNAIAESHVDAGACFGCTDPDTSDVKFNISKIYESDRDYLNLKVVANEDDMIWDDLYDLGDFALAPNETQAVFTYTTSRSIVKVFTTSSSETFVQEDGSTQKITSQAENKYISQETSNRLSVKITRIK